MTAMPTLFFSHGGPDIVISDTPARHFLENLAEQVPAPKAIVIVSAHFEASHPTVVSDPAPGMIYDFGGFAPELYEMVYPAPGSPELAARVYQLLDEAGLEPRNEPKRGFDHGTWTPLKLAFPEANVPVVQVSVEPDKDAAYHYRLGKALSPLRNEGILLIGSGHITHNLRAAFAAMRFGISDPEMADKVSKFTTWMADALKSEHPESVLGWKTDAPFALENHPSDEHLMPIFFALGAAGEGARAERIHHSNPLGVLTYDFYRFH
jgi:4,5-DOPA dioxygenase extradiol